MGLRRAELKQSSLDSFISRRNPSREDHPQPTDHHQTSDHPRTPLQIHGGESEAAAEYERARTENIRRNRDFLLTLGISRGVHAPRSDSRPQAKRKVFPRECPVSSVLPLRRSARKRSFSAPSIEIEPAAPQSPVFVDSSVFQYACKRNNAPADRLPPLESSPSSSSSCSSPVLGFRVTGKTLQSRSLAKIYTLDARHVNDERVLIAAGGHGGVISVFGVDENSDCEEGLSQEEIESPLLSWKASKSWISGVFFVDDNPMLMISSSNDGKIVVWDVGRQPFVDSLEMSWSPPSVDEAAGLHSGGIFSMHHLGHAIVTGSKDSCVVISNFSGGRLEMERKIYGHHSGVIRSVCFRETKDIIADCGGDGCVCILDGRLSEPCTLTIESTHETHINSLEWCPSDRNILLTASKDPVLRLYDIRNHAKPVQEFQGHVQSSTGICSQIYRPAFVNNGFMIATPGEGSQKISIYAVDSGTLVSKGMIGYDANLVFLPGENNGKSHLWTAGKQINQLRSVKFGELNGSSKFDSDCGVAAQVF
ncbi:uncharacterized protein LOC144710722 [Wolffia australiana]